MLQIIQVLYSSSSSLPIFFLFFLYLCFRFLQMNSNSHQNKAYLKKNEKRKSSHMYLFIALVNGGRREYAEI